MSEVTTMEEIKEEMQEENVVTADNEQENSGEAIEPQQEEEKSFTQSQVNDIVRARLDSDRSRFYKRYGVKDRDELDNLVNKSQAYDVMSEKYEQNIGERDSLREEVAFLRNNIEPKRYDDIRTYFKGKNVILNNENLIAELEGHPEWVKVNETPTTTIQTLSPNPMDSKPKEDERERASRYFGFSNGFAK